MCTACGHQYPEGMYTLYTPDYIKTAEQPYKLVRLLPGTYLGRPNCVRGRINKCKNCRKQFYWTLDADEAAKQKKL